MGPRTTLKLFVLTLGLSAVLASAQTTPPLSVTPNPATAGKAFVLYLQGITADCRTAFARESVTVTGTRIDLRYTSVRVDLQLNSPALPICPISVTGDSSIGAPTVLPNVPAFTMPALAAGKYDVWATDVPECVYNGCLIGMVPTSAGTLVVQQTAEPAYTFTPASTPEGKNFDLHLLSYGFSCATIYEDPVVHVVGNVITLSFYSREPMGVACPAVYKPYGPIFKIPALPAGNYQVRVDRNMMSALQIAGNLQVTGAVLRKSWYLQPQTVPPDVSFQMRIVQDGLPTCTSFSHLNAAVFTGGINVSFLMEMGKCASLSPDPIGPLFIMPAMKTGIYPIYVYELQPCEVAEPRCLLDRAMPAPSDTLVVAKTLAMRMSALRAGGPKAELRGNTAYFSLPEDKAGLWRAELVTLDGRMLADKSLAGKSGDRVSMSLDKAPSNAVSLLRLTSPAGTQRWLPIVR